MQVLAYVLFALCVACIIADLRFSANVSKQHYKAGSLFILGVVFGAMGLFLLNSAHKQMTEGAEDRIFEHLCYTGSSITYFIDSTGKKRELAKCDTE